MLRRQRLTVALAGAAVLAAAAPAGAAPARGQFQFTPLAASATCTVSGGDPVEPLVLPAGYAQEEVASEADPDFDDLPDMNTLNETGPRAGRFLFRSHEVSSNGSVSVTDLHTGDTEVVAQRADWERLDGIVWTPWQTILTAEEVVTATLPDPEVPQATAGLVYEIDPWTGDATPLPAVGSRSHEGLRFDAQGNLYGISEDSPPRGGYIYRFAPDRRGDLSSGQLYALKVTGPAPDGTGEAEWVPLDRDAVQVSSDIEAQAAGATGYARPEDVSIHANVLYVAITGEDRVLAIDLREPRGAREHATAFVSEYVAAGENAPADFDAPDNLAMDWAGNLYITEDPGGSFPGKVAGGDIWVATPDRTRPLVASDTVRFASLTDCDAEPTGIYFDRGGQHPLRERDAPGRRRDRQGHGNHTGVSPARRAKG